MRILSISIFNHFRPLKIKYNKFKKYNIIIIRLNNNNSSDFCFINHIIIICLFISNNSY